MSGKELRLIRTIYGYETQQELADDLGVARQTVQRHESMNHLDEKIIGQYKQVLKFDFYTILSFLESVRNKRRYELTKPV